MSYKVYGGLFWGHCPLERDDQKSFVDYVRKLYPATYGKLIVHIKNEGKRTAKQAASEKKQGLTVGASDIIIPGSPSFVCELKRKDKLQTKVTDKQIEYLEAAAKIGSFACLCYGIDEAIKAFQDYIKLTTK